MKAKSKASSAKAAPAKMLSLTPADVKRFSTLLKNGVLRTASSHDTAVQNNFALSNENAVKLSEALKRKK